MSKRKAIRKHRLIPVRGTQGLPFPVKLGRGQVVRRCSCGNWTTLTQESNVKSAFQEHLDQAREKVKVDGD